MQADQTPAVQPCRLGYEEYDGARYCFEHGAFLEAGMRTQRCAAAPALAQLTNANEEA